MAAASPRASPANWANSIPQDASYFQQRFQDFDKRLTAAEQKWDAADEALPRAQGGDLSQLVAATSPSTSASNVIGYVEPRPGIPPTPSHTIELIGLMKRENCKVMLVEPYFDLKTPTEYRPRDRRQGGAVLALRGRAKSRLTIISSCSITILTC